MHVDGVAQEEVRVGVVMDSARGALVYDHATIAGVSTPASTVIMLAFETFTNACTLALTAMVTLFVTCTYVFTCFATSVIICTGRDVPTTALIVLAGAATPSPFACIFVVSVVTEPSACWQIVMQSAHSAVLLENNRRRTVRSPCVQSRINYLTVTNRRYTADRVCTYYGQLGCD